MGQVLNIEIIENGQCLANCYYHWSAVTDVAYNLLKKIIMSIPNIRINNNPVLKAIRLFEKTGAGLIPYEVEYANNIGIHNFEIGTDRNRGLICISKQGINETRKWQDRAIYIYLDEKRIDFQVVNSINSLEWGKMKKYINFMPYENLSILKFNSNIRFDQIEEFGEFLKKYYKTIFKTQTGYVVQMISDLTRKENLIEI